MFTFGVQRASCDLTVLGMPGCALLSTPEATFAGTPGPFGGSRLGVGLPDDSNLIGVELLFQALLLEPGANALGVLSSNGLSLTIGECY